MSASTTLVRPGRPPRPQHPSRPIVSRSGPRARGFCAARDESIHAATATRRPRRRTSGLRPGRLPRRDGASATPATAIRTRAPRRPVPARARRAGGPAARARLQAGEYARPRQPPAPRSRSKIAITSRPAKPTASSPLRVQRPGTARRPRRVHHVAQSVISTAPVTRPEKRSERAAGRRDGPRPAKLNLRDDPPAGRSRSDAESGRARDHAQRKQRVDQQRRRERAEKLNPTNRPLKSDDRGGRQRPLPRRSNAIHCAHAPQPPRTARCKAVTVVPPHANRGERAIPVRLIFVPPRRPTNALGAAR